MLICNVLCEICNVRWVVCIPRGGSCHTPLLFGAASMLAPSYLKFNFFEGAIEKSLKWYRVRIMEITTTKERLGAALNYKYDREKVFARERERNKKHNEKCKESIRASSNRRRLIPKNAISTGALARIRWLMKHPDFAKGKCPPYAGRAIHIEKLLSVKVDVFRRYMEEQFHSGMTWENRGKVWHVGHRVPIRYFDCTVESQLLACFHYQNLQPELWEENTRRLNEVRPYPQI